MSAVYCPVSVSVTVPFPAVVLAASTPTPTPTPHDPVDYAYTCFIMQILTELLFSYNKSCKIAFLLFTPVEVGALACYSLIVPSPFSYHT